MLPDRPEPPRALEAPRLTRKILLSLDEGLFIVSNAYEPGWLPTFAEVVAPMAERELQWQRAKEAGAHGRRVAVFTSADAFTRWYAWFLTDVVLAT
ncbi:MAG: hypothetical protein ACI9K2_006978 [Myxococcota bacterium]|jgi:hypothetical protein